MQKVKQLLDKCSTGIEILYRNVVSWICFAILLFLYLVTTISTTILVRDDEGGHFFIMDHPIVFIIFLSVLLLAAVFIKNNSTVKRFIDRIKTDDEYFKKIRKKMLLVMGGIAAFVMLSTQFIPGADQYRIVNGVYELQMEDYSRFQPGEYFECYQNQYGLLLITYLFSLLFGNLNYIAFSFFNIAALLIFYYELSELCGEFEFGRPAQLSVIVIGYAFFPLIVYCSYFYGTLIGLAFGVAAIDKELKFFRTRKINIAVESAVLIMLSVVIKSNYMIFLIAAAICAIIELLRKKEIKLGLLPILIIAAAIISSALPKAIMSHITEYPLDGGASSWGWIAMGLQEGNRAPGAFNDYNLQLYRNECNFDSEQHAILSKEEVRERLHVFSENPGYALKFFTKKQAYQWGDPTFQYAWNIRGKTSVISMSSWVQKFKSPSGTSICLVLLNPLMTAVYFGALLFCILCRNKTNLYTLVVSMTFVGGYIFHTFWEAGPRYTLPYFVLLFPLTVAGYMKLVQMITQRKSKSRSKSKSNENTIRDTYLSLTPYLCIAVIVITSLGIFMISDHSLTADTAVYTQWLEANSNNQVIKEGKYKIYANSENGITLVEPKNSNDKETPITLSDDPTPVRIVNFEREYWFKFTDLHREISTSSNKNGVGAVIYTPDTTTNRWTIKNEQNGGVYIYNGKNALTYDSKNNKVYLSKYTGEKNQIWYLEKQ